MQIKKTNRRRPVVGGELGGNGSRTPGGVRLAEAAQHSSGGSSTEAVLVFTLTPEGEPSPFTDANATALAWLGYTPEELRRLTMRDVGGPEVIAALSRDRLRESGPLAVSSAYRTKAGRYLPVDVRLYAFSAGEALTVVAAAQGQAASQKQQLDALRLLGEASALLVASLDYETTLSSVAKLLVPALADWCVIDLVEEGHLNRVAVAHADPEKAGAAREYAERFPPDPEAKVGAAYVIRTGETEFYPELTDEVLQQAATSEEHLRDMHRIGMHSSIIVPLIARGRTLGAITLLLSGGERRYRDADLPLIQELARSCALAVDNARLYEEAQREIAQRTGAEEEVDRLNRDLQRRVDELQTLLEVAPVGIAVAHDPEGRVITANPAFASMLGISEEVNLSKSGPEADRLPFKVYRNGEEVPPEELPIQRAARLDQKVQDEELQVVREDGEERTLLEYAAPLHDEQGNVRGAIGAFVDVTEFKRAEQALRVRTRTLETVNRINTSLAAELDLEKLVQAVTDAGTELSGAQFGAFFYNVLNESGEAYMLYTISGVPREAFSRYPMPRNTAVFHPTFSGEGIMRLDDVTKDPRYGQNPPYHGMPEGHLPVRSYLAAPVISRSGEVIGGLFFGHEKPGVFSEQTERIIVGIADQAAIAIENARLYRAAQNELAERKRVEKELRERDERIRLLLNSAAEAIYGLDPYGNCTFVNEACLRMLGYSSPEELLGKNMHSLIHHTRPDGRPFPTEECPITAALRHGEGVHVEDEVLWRADGTSFPAEYWSHPIVRNGELVGSVVTFIDITERKQAEDSLRQRETELRALNETLEQRVVERTAAIEQVNRQLVEEIAERERAEKALERTNAALLLSNRELQEFAYVASHDLQEPLRKISSFADLLRDDYDDRLDDNGRFYLERMQEASERMSRLIRDLLSFSRVTTRGQPFRRIDLNEIVRGVLSDLEVRIEEVQGTVDVEPLPEIEADPTQMRQLFQNLIGNALKFHRPEVPPVIRVGVQTVEKDGQEICRVEVQDNGIGFEEKYLDRIFSPFQRLHNRNQYPGTGIGLAICRRIVERHDGAISAHSVPGEGSTFVIDLPVRQVKMEGGNA